jgi:hypothetical protein
MPPVERNILYDSHLSLAGGGYAQTSDKYFDVLDSDLHFLTIPEPAA